MPLRIITDLVTMRVIIPNNLKIFVRLFTSLLILSMCLFTVVRGWSITHFAEARARLLSGTAGADALRPWVGVPGLTGPALESSLAVVSAEDTDVARRRRSDDLVALLSVRPLSSANWLSLAANWQERSRHAPDVEGALSMSSLTGPNEGSLMWRRAVFGLLHWETLSEEAHGRTTTDLAGAMLGHVLVGDEVTLAGRLLSHKSSETRARIAAMLRGAGLPAAELTQLGLPGDAPDAEAAPPP